jgi:threonine dehydrogenase-like Zn-dependent dehydrogenase
MVMEATGGRGVDVTYEAVGYPEAVKEGMALTRRGGSYLSMGFGAPTGSIQLDVYHDLEIRDLRLQGVWVSHTKHTRMALELILEHRGLFRHLITHRFPLREATEALGVVEQRESVKAVLIP